MSTLEDSTTDSNHKYSKRNNNYTTKKKSNSIYNRLNIIKHKYTIQKKITTYSSSIQLSESSKPSPETLP